MRPSTIGERVRARRLLRGWSMRFAASRAGVSHATWSRIERGLQAADNRFMLADIAAALECSPAELAGTSVPAGDRAAVAAHTAVHALRQALVDIDLTAEPTWTPETIHDPTAEPTRATGTINELTAEPTRATGTIADLRRTVALLDSLRQACDYAAAARLAPTLLRDLHAAASTKTASTKAASTKAASKQAASQNEQRAQALKLLCDVTFIASSVLRNLGHPADAWLGAERCRDAAQASGDPVLQGYAEYARAAAATVCGSYDRALALATRAVDGLRPHTGRRGGAEVLGSLQLICALASRRGDDSRTWADEAATLAGRTGETTTLGLFFGPANVGIWRIGIEADRGDPGRAVEIARATDPAVIPAGFRQVFYYADTARALARLRNRDREAVRLLLIAERIAPQHVHTSALVRETTRALLDRSRRQAGGTELRGLGERLQIG